MTHKEMVALIRAGVTQIGGTWADFGAGQGNFTRALRELVGPNAIVYAIDQDAVALGAQQEALTIQADFTQPIPQLPPLDGLLLANAMHWLRDQEAALRLLTGYLRPGGCLLLVEYDVRTPRSFIPYPVPYPRFENLAAASGLEHAQLVGTRRSPSSGISMYAAAASQRSLGIG